MKKVIKNQDSNTSINNFASSSAYCISKENLIKGEEEEEFDDLIMIKNSKTMTLKKKAKIPGMEGYNSSDEEED